MSKQIDVNDILQKHTGVKLLLSIPPLKAAIVSCEFAISFVDDNRSGLSNYTHLNQIKSYLEEQL